MTASMIPNCGIRVGIAFDIGVGRDFEAICLNQPVGGTVDWTSYFQKAATFDAFRAPRRRVVDFSY